MFLAFLAFLENGLFHGNIDTAFRNETPLSGVPGNSVAV